MLCPGNKDNRSQTDSAPSVREPGWDSSSPSCPTQKRPQWNLSDSIISGALSRNPWIQSGVDCTGKSSAFELLVGVRNPRANSGPRTLERLLDPCPRCGTCLTVCTRIWRVSQTWRFPACLQQTLCPEPCTIYLETVKKKIYILMKRWISLSATKYS